MRTDPFLDSLLFLIGYDDNYKPLGAAQYVLIVGFDLLVVGNLCLLVYNWRHDPAQRRCRHLYIWLARSLVGAMWFQGSIWKLPLPVSGGFQYWMGQIEQNAAFPAMAALYRDLLLPNIAVLNVIAYLAELGFSIALMLGFVTRLTSALAMVFAANIWLGLYHNGSEWPWQYMFLILLLGFLALEAAGRSLGLDALLRRSVRPNAGRALLVRAYLLMS
ncbi:MAG: DoxX family protein [Alphaproteobacteria bacterium]|nr:DoxX family protein [Alphaproteobacteria bacterium]